LSQSDISLLSGVATQIAISIHNALSYQKIQESRERESKLRQLFERYVPAPIIKRYTDSKETELFRGDELAITAMFLDIRGFTTSSETMDAKDVVSFLNGFFDKCSAIISEEGGHINKYTGDGFFAIFGAPEPMANHALLAFNAALKILEFSANINLAGKTMGLGMGLHAGKAILGNIGSQTKIEYTAVGDTVNTAARLQELTKQFQDFPIIISKDTFDKLGGHPEHDLLKYLGEQTVRGKKEKLEAYGFGGEENPVSTLVK
jgi:adenylate cyclase